MTKSDEPGIDFLTGSLAYAVKRAQVRIYDAVYEVYKDERVTPARMTALCLVATRPGMSQSALAELMHVNRASIIKIVNHLQETGLITCRENEQDRRSHILETTQEGHEKLRRLARLTVTLEQGIARNLTRRERDTLMRLLEKAGR